MQMQDTKAALSSRVAALQAEVDALRASSAACYDACDDRIQTERAQQRKANEEMRVAMQTKLQDATRETEQAKNHLVILSKQHQLTLVDRESQYNALQTAMDKAEKDQQQAILKVVEDGCTAVLEVTKSLHEISQTLKQVCSPQLVIPLTAARAELPRPPALFNVFAFPATVSRYWDRSLLQRIAIAIYSCIFYLSLIHI